MKWWIAHQKVRPSYGITIVVVDMKKMVQEMVSEVETLEQETPATEELYSKLELKVRKKFNEEIDRLEKSFRRIME